MSPFISVGRRARRRPAPPVIAVLLATAVLLASFALPAFGLSTTKLISEALSTAKKADKDAKKADKDARSAGTEAKSADADARSADTDAKNSSVGTVRLQDGAVTGSKLASGSVGSSQIIPGSVSIDDLSGASANTTFALPAVVANTCSTAEVPDADAAITDFPMISFPGPTNLPLQLSATVLRVDTAGSVRVKFCNGTTVDAAAVAGVNIEVVTLR